MKPLLLALMLVACNDPTPAPGNNLDLAASSDLSDAAMMSCSGGCSAQQFCYSGAETGFFQGDGGVQVGCNPLPAGCMLDCNCILQSFAAGFCTCRYQAGLPIVQCSFV